jgi:hypothetical protein
MKRHTRRGGWALALALPVEVEEAVESDRPVRYSLPEGMLSAILLVVCFRRWLMVVVWSLTLEVTARVTMYELGIPRRWEVQRGAGYVRRTKKREALLPI